MNMLCDSPPRSSTWPRHPPCGWSRSHQEDDIAFMLAFFDEVLGQLQPHHQFPDLGTGERQLALLRLPADRQAPRALLEEHALPALEFVRRDLALARDRIERLAPQQSQHQLRLPYGAPACRQLSPFHRRWLAARSRLPLFAHRRPPWLLSS